MYHPQNISYIKKDCKELGLSGKELTVVRNVSIVRRDGLLHRLMNVSADKIE